MARFAAVLAVLALSVLVGETDAIAQTPAAPQPFADPACPGLLRPAPACPRLAEVTAILDKNHETYVVLDVNDALSLATETPAHIILATVGQIVTLGYESEGCVIGPLGLAKILPKHAI